MPGMEYLYVILTSLLFFSAIVAFNILQTFLLPVILIVNKNYAIMQEAATGGVL